MNNILLVFVCLGIILIIIGYYEQKLKVAENNKKIEYKFIPRTFYDDQTLSDDKTLLYQSLEND